MVKDIFKTLLLIGDEFACSSPPFLPRRAMRTSVFTLLFKTSCLMPAFFPAMPCCCRRHATRSRRAARVSPSPSEYEKAAVIFLPQMPASHRINVMPRPRVEDTKSHVTQSQNTQPHTNGLKRAAISARRAAQLRKNSGAAEAQKAQRSAAKCAMDMMAMRASSQLRARARAKRGARAQRGNAARRACLRHTATEGKAACVAKVRQKVSHASKSAQRKMQCHARARRAALKAAACSVRARARRAHARSAPALC